MKILVVHVAALSHRFLSARNGSDRLAGFDFRPIDSVFPAVTCPIQATMRTATLPKDHGIVANGFYSRDFGRPFFWEQSSSLIEGPRIWDDLRARGGTVGQLFLQQSLGPDSDVLISPAPIHKHHGGLIQDCYARPTGFYQELIGRIGKKFSLMNYWGPMSSIKSTRWIADATIHTLSNPAPDLLFTYLPHLDYELQKSGPESEKSAAAFRDLKGELTRVVESASTAGYGVLIYGDYEITPVTGAAHPNRALREAGLLTIRRIRDMEYPDLAASRAFCVVDHQVGHVVLRSPTDADSAREALTGLSGVEAILGDSEKRDLGIDHPRAGGLVITSTPDRWFAYPWWTEKGAAPDYASHIDIHNKPGFDPCELFFTLWPPLHISTDVAKIGGSHGLTGAGREATFATDLPFETQPGSLLELSRALAGRLERSAV